jgi:polysaccharide export outer membrane protein
MNKITLVVVLIITFGLFYQIHSQVLNPGDGIRLIFLDITDQISGDYYIQPDGKLQLPFVGIISTANREFSGVKAEIIEKYNSLYRNPELNVLSLFRINILGEVSSPGYYFVTEEEKLSGILALAGGPTGDADLEGMYLVRNDKEIELDFETIMAEGNTIADIGLKSGDQIFVPRSFWADPGRFTWIFSALAVVVAMAALFITR